MSLPRECHLSTNRQGDCPSAEVALGGPALGGGCKFGEFGNGLMPLDGATSQVHPRLCDRLPGLADGRKACIRVIEGGDRGGEGSIEVHLVCPGNRLLCCRGETGFRTGNELGEVCWCWCVGSCPGCRGNSGPRGWAGSGLLEGTLDSWEWPTRLPPICPCRS
jgi:hypothetical protein